MAEAITGLSPVRREFDRLEGVLEEALLLGAMQLHRYSTGIVHVDQGRLKNSLFVTKPYRQAGDLLSLAATNVEYAPMEEFRGGGHAFFGRTVREEGPAVRDILVRVARGD